MKSLLPSPKQQEIPPPPEPGTVVNVPFDLWPQYLARHGLEVMQIWWDERQGQLYAKTRRVLAPVSGE